MRLISIWIKVLCYGEPFKYMYIADMYSFPVFIACAVQKNLHAITFQ